MKKIYLLLIFLIVLSVTGNAQKIIAIAFANTVDKGIDGKGGIGASCLVDYDNFVRESSIIASYLDYEIEYHDFIGQECTKENLMSTMARINPSSNDIVFFYYSGHGTHAPNDNDLLPQICFKYSSIADQEHFLALRTVKEKLSTKHARLNIIMADCCNNVMNGVMPRIMQRTTGNTTVTENAADNYKKLFLTNKGTIILTGCEKGQTSGGYDDIGGIFSSAFWDKLLMVGKGQINATWEALAQNTQKQTAADTSNEQIPYYDLSGLNSTIPVVGTTPVNVVSTNAPDLANALKQLIDPAKSIDQRLALMDDVMNHYFISGAKVVIVGRNSTNVGYEDIKSFLKRICISNRIKEIIILSNTSGGGGKTTYMKIHEVRKQ